MRSCRIPKQRLRRTPPSSTKLSPMIPAPAAHPKTAARRAALRALVSSEKSEMVAPDFSVLDALVRPFAREIYSGTQRWRAKLDWTLAPLLSKPLSKLDAPVRAALRLAIYERLEGHTPPHALASEYAGLMRGEKLASATAFVNAITRRLPETYRAAPTLLAARLATDYAHPNWLVERYLKRFGAVETEALLCANQTRAPLCLRVNTLQTTRESVLSELGSSGIAAHAGALSPDAIIVDEGLDPARLPAWNRGDVFAQDEAAQLVARFASPEAGSRVLDCASAPGGKATHLAQLMENRGEIVALDLAPGRVKLVEQNAARLGISVIQTRAFDLKLFVDEAGFDLVLLDAPCSGTGTFRRRPDAKWNRTPEDLKELISLQRALIDAAARHVRPGGVLVYSTCSLEIEENQGQASAFTERSGWETVAPDNLVSANENWIQTAPHREGADGMFAAKWRRPL